MTQRLAGAGGETDFPASESPHFCRRAASACAAGHARQRGRCKKKRCKKKVKTHRSGSESSVSRLLAGLRAMPSESTLALWDCSWSLLLPLGTPSIESPSPSFFFLRRSERLGTSLDRPERRDEERLLAASSRSVLSRRRSLSFSRPRSNDLRMPPDSLAMSLGARDATGDPRPSLFTLLVLSKRAGARSGERCGEPTSLSMS